MCRLLGIYGQVRFWKEIALEFRKLAELGKVPPIVDEPGHRDGWGMAGANDDKSAMIEIARRLGAADHSTFFKDTIQSLEQQPYIFLCHLRKASPNVPVSIDNVHPFFHCGWAFSHNGTIYNAETLPRDPAFKLTSQGSDSEYLFHFLLFLFFNQRNDQNILKTVSDAISSLKMRYTALNCILSNGRELFVIRDYNEFGDYYTLYYYLLPKGTIICSEPLQLPLLDQNKWQEIPNRSILRIKGTPPDISFFSRTLL